MAVAVDVIDTVIVAVHLHGNDTVIVIRPVIVALQSGVVTFDVGLSA